MAALRRTFGAAISFALVAFLSLAIAAHAAPCYQTNLLYSVSSANTDIYTIDPANGFAIASIGATSFVSAASARSPLDGKVYYISESTTPQLGNFNPATATNGTPVTITGLANADTANGDFVRASFSEDGTLYAGSNQTTTIYRITTAGVATAVPISGFVAGAGDMAFDPANPDAYYTVVQSATSYELYHIVLNAAPATATAGTATDIGSLGVGSGVEVFGIAYGNDGVLYATDQGSTSIFSINTATGVATQVSTVAIPGHPNDLGSLPVPQKADLSVVKTHATPVEPGQTINYSLTITNGTTTTSSCTLNAVTIVDTLPTNVTLSNVAYTAPSGGAYNATTGELTGITLAPGASVVLGVSGTVPTTTTAGTTFVNKAVVSPPTGFTLPDSNAANNTSSDTATVVGLADLTVAKTGPARVDQGTTATYSITVTNSGPSAANAAPFVDTVPSNFTSVTTTCAASGGAVCPTVAVGNAINTTIPTFPSGGSVVFTVTGTATTTTTGTGVTNTATIAPPTGTNATSNSVLSSSVTTTVIPAAKITVTKTGTATQAAGGAVTYTVGVTNAGPASANGSQLVDTVPSNFTNVTTTCAASGGAVCPTIAGGNALNVTIATLPSGGTLTLTVTGTATTVTTGVTNTATLTLPSGTDAAAGSTLSASQATVVTANAKLTVTKTGTATQVQGGAVSYTVGVTNAGPSAANGTTLVDTVPSNITGVTTTCTATGGAVCPTVASGNAISVTIATLPSAGTLTFTVTGTATTATTGAGVTNTATIAPPSGTTAAAGSVLSASQATTITPAAKLTVTKTGTASTNVGGAVSYTVGVTNAGPSAANGTTLVDTVPSNITGVTTTCAATGSAVCPTVANGNAINVTIATLPSGGALTFTVTGTATTATSGTGVTNTATIAPPSGTAAATGSVLSAQQVTVIGGTAGLTITKTAPATAAVGGLISYTIEIDNNGPSSANGTTFSDPVPAGLTIKGTPTCAASAGVTCGAPAVSGQNVTATISVFPSGGKALFTIDVTTTAAATYNNTATVGPPSGITDPNALTSSASTVVSATSGGFTKTVQNITQSGSAVTANTAKPGDVLQYSLTFTNTTNAPITGLTLNDFTPPNTTYVAGSAACGTVPGTTPATTCTPSATASATQANPNQYTVSFTLAGNTLALGASITVTFRVKVQ